MYTKQEASVQRQKFWISFGKYMAPIPSSTGGKINWINYRTGIKPISFKMDATARDAYIAIEIQNKNSLLADRFYNTFMTLKDSLEELLEEKWEWENNHVNESGNEISRIFIIKKSVNIFQEKDWPEIISFFKNRIILLDKFWNEYREIFEAVS